MEFHEHDRERKRARRAVVFGGGGTEAAVAPVAMEYRCWEGLNPELLALIFTKLPSDELARTLSFVCRGWADMIAGPHCWSSIDIEEWCLRVRRTDLIDVAIRKLVRRSSGMLRRLSAYHIGNSGFSFTALFGKQLKVLQIPMSEVNDQTLEKGAGSLPALSVLDISFCRQITYKGIEALGKHCKSLVSLSRKLSPPGYEAAQDDGVEREINEDEAVAVGTTMLGLEKLELVCGRFSDLGLNVILTNCKKLRSLDIRDCLNVSLEGSLYDKCHLLKFFADPFHDSYDLSPLDCEEGSAAEGGDDDD